MSDDLARWKPKKKEPAPVGVQPVIESAGKPRKMSVLTKIKTAVKLKQVLNEAKSNNYMLSKNWKTSLFGTGGLIVMWANVASMLLDGNDATNPDWSLVITATISAAGLLFAKDYNATGKPQ